MPARHLAARPLAAALLAALLPALPAAAQAPAQPPPPAAAAQPPLRYEGSLFDLPEGWGPLPNATGPNYIVQRSFAGDARGRGRGAALIQIAPPVTAPASQLDAIFTQATRSIPELAEERPTLRREGETVNGHRIRYDTRCCGRRNGASLASETVGIATDRTIHVLALVTVNLRGDDRQAAEADFDALVRSFRPTEADRAFSLQAPQGGGGLQGVYTHLDTGLRPNAFGGLDFYADSEVLVFDPAGLFSTSLPPGGRDMAAHCREAPGDCGTYRLADGRIELRETHSRFGLIEVEQESLAREGQDLRIGDTLHRFVPPLPADTRLEGRWRYFYGSAGSTAFSSGSVAVERLLTLTRDGRFQRSGFAGFSGSSDTGGGSSGVTVGSQRPAGQGRYRIEGYSLTLTGDDGRQEVFSLFMPDKDSDGVLTIDGSNYLKRDE
ncbi:hypothetical protein [Pseudoroseomonas cervicalis]|uniref:hypothetical protein n=1 Tax=Teichococcus cervicalis TaxID=204525 RepID=UPI0022F1D97F|nr:hypothetical protein [Pseudoroseomonas cervicalis]WBV45129.1 hypothetical protein PFY06_20025 [Pseudoroseomonas cervicalis]